MTTDMLFVQKIELKYKKDVRYPEYAMIRQSEKFRPMNLKNSEVDGKIIFNDIMLFQDTDGLYEDYNKIRQYNDEAFYNPRCYYSPFGERIAVKESDGGSYEIMYKNKTSHGYYKNPFTLKNNEYGRIIYNERNIGEYTGIWYYYLIAYNFINCDKSGIREKMFFRKSPDYEYKDMKYLRYC